jgi:hypothetical protein
MPNSNVIDPIKMVNGPFNQVFVLHHNKDQQYELTEISLSHEDKVE